MHLHTFVDEVDLENCWLHVVREFGSLLNLELLSVCEIWTLTEYDSWCVREGKEVIGEEWLHHLASVRVLLPRDPKSTSTFDLNFYNLKLSFSLVGVLVGVFLVCIKVYLMLAFDELLLFVPLDSFVQRLSRSHPVEDLSDPGFFTFLAQMHNLLSLETKVFLDEFVKRQLCTS